MKNLIKIFSFLLIFMMSFNTSYAIQTGQIDKLIKKSDLQGIATISVSIKNAEKNEVVYEYDSKKLLNPASSLKLFTAYSAMETLGYDYLFKTQFYKDNQNNLYIKLGADPMLTSKELSETFEKLKKDGVTSLNNIYFDDSIIDKQEFSQGWMWDDDINPYIPKVSAYNLDKNLIQVNMIKTDNGAIQLMPKTTYPTSIYSYIQSGQKSETLNINRYNWNNPEVVEIFGTVTTPKPFYIPVSSMRRYFIHNIENCLENSKITIKSTKYASKLVPQNAVLLMEITHPISDALPFILQNSDNLIAETVFKLAAANKYSTTGNDILAAKMFEDFYNKIGINTDDIIIKDGNGVSRYNLVYADWMTEALDKLYKLKDFEKFKDNMAQPGDGTLSNRLFELRGDAWFKTGTLSNISTITGFVNSQDGNLYSVAILTQNFKNPPLEIKEFENKIINLIYSK